MPVTQKKFSAQILKWYDLEGRKNLPWRTHITPYRVWISETMLQQTQVSTVIPYFQRFIERFPTLSTLAESPLDDVLSHWSGLGYYARARNLYKTAQVIHHQFQGAFPKELNALISLPGIGRSTAGAISAIGMQQRAPILDGNVKRVLTRFHAISGWPGKSGIENQLWIFSEKYTPHERVDDYTQAIMDLGATVCTRTQPNCVACPLMKQCAAYQADEVGLYPSSKPSKKIPTKSVKMLMMQNASGKTFLMKRPSSGIWGGLWSFPECPSQEDVTLWCWEHYGCKVEEVDRWPEFRHTFSHFHLDIQPVLLNVMLGTTQLLEQGNTVWCSPPQVKKLGLAAPIKRLLEKLGENDDSHRTMHKTKKTRRRTRTRSVPR